MTQATGATVHVLPVGDLVEHIESADCWCVPDVGEDGRLIVHHSADGRELYEPDHALTKGES